MKVDVIINLKKYLKNRLIFSIKFNLNKNSNKLVFNLLKIETGIELKNIEVLDTDNNKINYSIEDNLIVIDKQIFTLNYEVDSIFKNPVGYNRSVEFLYPFLNEREIFLGSGSIPYPVNLAEISDDIDFVIDIINLPENWNILSNIKFGIKNPPILDTFFIYCSIKKSSYLNIYHGKNSNIKFNITIQENREIPISIEDLFLYINKYCRWLEKNLAPLRKIDKIDILILQAPLTFKQLTNNESSATGENMLNAILLYGPNDNNYYKKLFGYKGYDRFIYDAITHELMHSYTTTSWQGKYKSILYPSLKCSYYNARVIGELLNIYFHNKYLYDYFNHSDDFITEVIHEGYLKKSLMPLFLLDRYLQKENTSLLELFSKLLFFNKGAFDSLDILFKTSQKELGITIKDYFNQKKLKE